MSTTHHPFFNPAESPLSDGPFSEAEVPTVFFSDSTGGCYHTSGDEVDVVDFGKHQKQARIGYYVTRGLIDGDTRPAFVSGLPAATFEDLVSVRDIIDMGLADLGLFGPEDQSTLQGFGSFLEGLVQEGESEFGTESALRVSPRFVLTLRIGRVAGLPIHEVSAVIVPEPVVVLSVIDAV